MLKSLNKYYASNTQDAIDAFKDTLVAAGWTLHDDLSGSSPYAYVLKSEGESGTEFPCYLYLHEGTNRIQFLVYADWDNVAHAGTFYCGNVANTRIDGGNAAAFYCWCSATMDSAVFASYYSSEYDMCWVGMCDPIEDDGAALGILQAGVAAGSDVVLQLDTDQAVKFKAGRNYQLFEGSKRQWVQVNAVDTVNDQVAIATLSYAFSSGARIGAMPNRWALFSSEGPYSYVFTHDTNGTGNDSSAATIDLATMLNAVISPDARTGQYVMWPVLLHDKSNIAVFGWMCGGTVMLRMYIGTTSEHTVSVGDRDSGTSTGSNTATTLNDTGKAWTVNEHAGKALIITAGTGAGQFRAISSNTGSELTVDTAWETTPDETSAYTICDEGWLYLYFNSNAGNTGAIRII